MKVGVVVLLRGLRQPARGRCSGLGFLVLMLALPASRSTAWHRPPPVATTAAGNFGTGRGAKQLMFLACAPRRPSGAIDRGHVLKETDDVGPGASGSEADAGPLDGHVERTASRAHALPVVAAKLLRRASADAEATETEARARRLIVARMATFASPIGAARRRRLGAETPTAAAVPRFAAGVIAMLPTYPCYQLWTWGSAGTAPAGAPPLALDLGPGGARGGLALPLAAAGASRLSGGGQPRLLRPAAPPLSKNRALADDHAFHRSSRAGTAW